MALTMLRVVEIGTGSALAYAGKIFAAFGADVLKLEPQGGDPGRAEPPLVDAGGGRMESAYFAWLNAGKRSRIGDATMDGVDVLLDARALTDQAAGSLAHDTLRAKHPGLVIIALSLFGETGPYRDYRGTDATLRALAGLIHLIGPVDKPVAINDHQADIITGITAYIAAMAALLGGGGRRMALSALEANAVLSDSHTVVGPTGPRARLGVNRFSATFPVGVYPCREGWLGLGISTPQQWRDFCALFGVLELANDSRYDLGVDRSAHADEIEAKFAPKLLERSAAEWFAEGLRHRLPFAIVPEMKDLLRQDVPRANGAFAEIMIGAAKFEGPLVPHRLTLTPPRSGGTAPLAGEDTLPPARAARPRFPATTGLPLAGLKIVDFTMGWAGPLVARHMADLGAEVIKIEACRHYDWWRGQDHRPESYASKVYEKRPNFLALNRNKQGITLDLTTAEGVALAKSLVARADGVVENFSREVMPKLGLDYSALRAVNPELVMISMAAFPKGPWEAGRAYGFTLEQAAGVPTVAGPPEGPPMLSHYAYGDPVGGLNGTASLLTALWHKRVTGKGQYVDLSQVECMLPMIAPWMIAQSSTGETPPRMGNRHPINVPQNIFRCAGSDDFILVSITDEPTWRALCAVIRRPDLAQLSAIARRAREDEIEAAVETWTAGQNADAAMAILQAAGVAAGVVRSPYDLAEDPQYVALGFWQMVSRPFVAPHVQSSLPFREGLNPYPVHHPAPTMGEFNRAVLGGILGMKDDELTRLEAAEIIGTMALPPRRRAH